MGAWDWIAELESALARLGLDTDIGNTRLGYEKSGTTITRVGMTPSKEMKEWTLTESNGGWACDTACEAELDDLLFVLEKIGAIVAPLPTHHSKSLCKSIFLSKPKEITSPSKSTLRQTVFFTDLVVFLWIFLKPNAFFAALNTSSIRDLFSRKGLSSLRCVNNRLARLENRFISCFVSVPPKIQRG